MGIETQTMETIRADIRSLIAKYGVSAVHAELQAEMRQTYEFLRQLYEPAKKNLVIPVAEVIPDRIATPHHKPIASTVVAMEPPQFALDSAQESEEVETETVPPQHHDPSLKEVVIQAKREMSQASLEQAPAEKFSKAKHKEDVVKKYKELQEKGIRPEDLLTKENLTLWLSQGMSYMRIARELTGVPESQVAAIAKNFGLQSDIKKYVVMKKSSGNT
jgi:hypothetical protein